MKAIMKQIHLIIIVLTICLFSCAPVTAFCQQSVLDTKPESRPVPVAAAPSSIPPDLSLRLQPLVTQSEAIAGSPYGIGRITFRMRHGDEMILRTGAALLSERSNRILYPVQTGTELGTFIQVVTGNVSSAPDDQHTILFLFKGNQPLELRLDGTGTAYQVVDVETAKPNRYKRFLKLWWREFEKVARRQMNGGDYPGVVETYLISMLRQRLGLQTQRRQRESRGELRRTVDLLFDVETLRNDAIERAMAGQADNTVADRPLPPEIDWSPIQIDNLPTEVAIEPIVRSVPEECFYLRFGTWQNHLWMQRLTEEFGGDLGRMIQLRGYKPKIQSKFLDQLAIQSTEFDKLFGGRLIDDVAVIGMDAYVDEGASIGVMFHAKNSKMLSANLRSKRANFVDANRELGAEIIESEYGGHKIQFLTTPGNRYRSFYVVHEDNHLLTTSLAMARRFLEASEGRRSLADSDEFKFARVEMPLEREDTIFVYLSTKFFQQLLSPQYQIELQRRNRVISDMQLLEVARLAASHEGLDAFNLDSLAQNGFLPVGFGLRPDNSQFVGEDRVWSDSIRGQRGFFTPIADMAVNSVSQDEYDWFVERARFFADNIHSLDPMLIGIKRFAHESKANVERVIFDARVAPFAEDKYGWLINMLGPTLEHEIARSPDDIISLQASFHRNGGMKREPSDHHLFAAVQDEMDPSVDLRPTSALQLLQTLREAPAYLGSWPKAGYLDWLPALGGDPGPDGFTYSRFLKLWRMQSDDFSVIAFERERLEKLKPELAVIPSERPAQIRLLIGDLVESRLKDWANAVNYRRSWETSIANTKLLNMLTQQFGIAPEIALPVAQQLLNVDLVCSLGGNYQLYQLPSGRNLWASTAWPSFADPAMPNDYKAPLLTWFRGALVEVIQTPTRFAVHGYLDIERNPAESQSQLPSFDMLKGFSNMFGVGAKNEKPDKE